MSVVHILEFTAWMHEKRRKKKMFLDPTKIMNALHHYKIESVDQNPSPLCSSLRKISRNGQKILKCLVQICM